MSLRDLARAGLRDLPPYRVPHVRGIVAKLDANEHPHPLPAELAAELGRVLAAVPLHRYPDIECRALRALVATELAVAPAQLCFGNGSDELIALLTTAYAEPRPGRARAAIGFPVPSFSVFAMAARAAGCDPVELPLAADFTLDEPGIERALAAARPNLCFFARPNNPTGTLWPSAAIERWARQFPDTLFVSDEAYAAYAGDSMLDRVGVLPNLLVMRTLSKIGLAALRVGYLVAPPALLAPVEAVRGPYNLGALNQVAACWLLEHAGAVMAARCAEVVRERARVAGALARLPGVTAFPSEANLVLLRIGRAGDGAAARVWQALCDRGVLVRNFDGPHGGPLAGCLRVTIGTPSENDRFLTELAAALAAAPA